MRLIMVMRSVLSSDLVGTRAGRATAAVVVAGWWWTGSGAFLASGRPGSLMLLGGLSVPVVLAQLGAHREAYWRRVVGGMAAQAAECLVVGVLLQVLLAGGHVLAGGVLAAVVPASVLLQVLKRCLPPVAVLSPELRPWLAAEPPAAGGTVQATAGQGVAW